LYRWFFKLGSAAKVPQEGTDGSDERYCSKTNIRILPRLAIPPKIRDGKGKNMTVDKGNKLARAVMDNSLDDKLATDPKLDSGSQKRIGDQLRAMYDELMQQPVPDRFRELLDQLDKKNGSKEGSQ
jgi:anti-sigma factor NepR-like protein